MHRMGAGALLVAAVWFSGCAVDSSPPFQATKQRVSTANRLSLNGLSANRLSLNRLSANRLSANGLSLNAVESGGLEESEEGRELLAYVVKCALEDGQVLTVSVDGQSYEFHGLVGLAPRWRRRALRRDERDAVSGCLLAHVNAYGVSVPISIRWVGEITAPEEASRFSFHEGAFFGNVFSRKQTLYACAGDSAPDYYGGAPDLDFGDRLLRACSDPSREGDTFCGFEYAGRCSRVCARREDNDYGRCYESAAQRGVSYALAVNTWLLGHDDSWSVWPRHLGLIESIFEGEGD